MKIEVILLYRRYFANFLLLSLVTFNLLACGDSTSPTFGSFVPTPTNRLETTTSLESPTFTASPTSSTPTIIEQVTSTQTPSMNLSNEVEIPLPTGLSEITSKLPSGYLNDLKKQLPNGVTSVDSVRVFTGQKDGCVMTMEYNNQVTAAGWIFVQNNGSNQPIVSSGGTCNGIYQKEKVQIEVGGINLETHSGPPVDFYQQIVPGQRDAVRKAIGTAKSIFVIYITQLQK